MRDTTVGRGRHRLGRPGGIAVATLVRVVRRNWLLTLFTAGKHRATEPALTGVRRPAPAHAV